MAETDATSRSVAGVFDLSRRGYDRRQVDDHLSNLMVQLSEAERARRREESRANRAEAELTDLRERMRNQAASPRNPETDRLAVGAEEESRTDTGGSAHSGFGLRVEKLLRAAEQEAADTRDGATREAAALVEQARVDAESHRREVEDALSARDAEIDKKALRRTVELDERERQVSEQSAAARDEADRLLAEARGRAEQIGADARSQAAHQLAETEKAVDERRTAADDELNRLRTVRRGVRGDLARMLAALAGELQRPDVEAGGEHPDEHTVDAASAVAQEAVARESREGGAASAIEPPAADWFSQHAAADGAERGQRAGANGASPRPSGSNGTGPVHPASGR